MPFHVMIWPASPEQQVLRELYAFDLTEQQLRERFIEPYERGTAITWGGRSLPPGDISTLQVSESPQSVGDPGYAQYDTFKAHPEVTNDWVTGPPGTATPLMPASESDLEAVLRLCRRFELVSRKLRKRHGNRPAFEVTDEYDVQDLMFALLATRLDDVRKESWNPSYLGGGSRVDFLLPTIGAVLEIKKTRETLRDKQVGSELAEDVTRYSDPASNRGAKCLICFVHDPDHYIDNPRGLESDLADASNERLKVVGVVA